jgi:uncharacterized protein
VPIDTGFMVFNFKTYPNLCKLFDELKVPIKKTDMSFSVHFKNTNLQYCGTGINGLFAQRQNIFNIPYLKMLWQISRFNKYAVEDMLKDNYRDLSLIDYIKARNYGMDMLEQYLIPMSSAVWSTPMDKMLEFPAKSLIQFFHNHGFLGLHTQHQWYTPDGGSEVYKQKILTFFEGKVNLNSKIERIAYTPEGKVELFFNGSSRTFDKVVFASHADETLAVLGEQANDLEKELLSPFKYQLNKAVLHTDASVMPSLRGVWSSWNYIMKTDKMKDFASYKTSTVYWMNSLQGVSKKLDYFVSINPLTEINPSKVLKTIDYHHPLFDEAAIKAQVRIHELNHQSKPIYFCGSYFKYGFHEDAYTAGIQCAEAILKQ